MKQGWKYVNVPDQDQIIDGSCIGDYQLHSSEAQSLQGVHFKVEIVESIVDPNLMGF